MTIAELSSIRHQPANSAERPAATISPDALTSGTKTLDAAGGLSFDSFQPSFELGHGHDGFSPGAGPNFGAWDSCDPSFGATATRNIVNITMDSNPQYQAAMASAGVTMQSGSNPSGSLYVIDDFLATNLTDMNSSSTLPHGYHVAAAAHQQNPEAPIIGVQDSGLSEILLRTPSATLYTPGLPPEEARGAIGDLATQHAIGLNMETAASLRELSCDGVTQSVANFSAGTSIVRMAGELYQQMLPSISTQPDPEIDPGQLARSQALTDNVVSAFSLDRAALSHPDQATRAQARADMFEQISTQLHQGFQSQTIEPSRVELERAVTSFEALGNSVVIAAGNDANLTEVVQQALAPMDLPSGMSDNVLNASDATPVGAASSNGLEPYSNPGTLQASGVSPLDSGVIGSSFAAPRVASEILAVQLQNSNFDSDQAVAEVTDESTRTLSTATGLLKILE